MNQQSQLTYRPATPGDRDTIVQFQLAMARETEAVTLDEAICTNGVQAVFDEPRHGRYFAAELEDRVVGSLLITYEWSDWRNGVVWWIQSVYVVPPARRRGVYSGLYAYVKQMAEADPDVHGIRLYTDRHNEAAQRAYVRLGMDGDHYRMYEWMKRVQPR